MINLDIAYVVFMDMLSHNHLPMTFPDTKRTTHNSFDMLYSLLNTLIYQKMIKKKVNHVKKAENFFFRLFRHHSSIFIVILMIKSSFKEFSNKLWRINILNHLLHNWDASCKIWSKFLNIQNSKFMILRPKAFCQYIYF